MEWGALPPPSRLAWRYARQTSVVIYFIVFAFNAHRAHATDCTRKSNYTFRLAPTNPKIGFMAVQISEIIAKSRPTKCHDLYRFFFFFAGANFAFHFFLLFARMWVARALAPDCYDDCQLSIISIYNVITHFNFCHVHTRTHTHSPRTTWNQPPSFPRLLLPQRTMTEKRVPTRPLETGMMMMSFCRNNSINTANLIVCHSLQQRRQ